MDQDAKKQVSTFLYCLGEQAETVLSSTSITEEQRKLYDAVIGKFDSFFKVTRNVIEQAQFNRHFQREGESAEQFIVELYNLEFCNYEDLASEMIHDRLVVGIRDCHLSEHLQLDSELTLKRIKEQFTKVKLYKVNSTSSKEPPQSHPAV